MGKIADTSMVAVDSLKPYEKNAKIHSADQIQKIADSIKEFGFLSPCLIDSDMNVIAGHGRIEAAKLLGMEEVPCVFIEGLNETQRKAYILADNRLGEIAEWDIGAVNAELIDLKADGFDIDLTGFELKLDQTIPENKEISLDDFADETFAHECPKCGFMFND